ncbi:MAG: hypothetical protein ACOC04_05590 [Halothece sp.]
MVSVPNNLSSIEVFLLEQGSDERLLKTPQEKDRILLTRDRDYGN